MASPGESQAGRRVKWQVAAEALAFQGKVPSDQGQVGAEQNPWKGALQPKLSAEHRLNLLAESGQLQVSFLKNPQRSPAIAFHQPPEGEADKGCPSKNTNPQDSARRNGYGGVSSGPRWTALIKSAPDAASVSVLIPGKREDLETKCNLAVTKQGQSGTKIAECVTKGGDESSVAQG